MASKSGASKSPRSNVAAAGGPVSRRPSTGNLTSAGSAGFLAATTSSPTTRLSQQAILAAEAAREDATFEDDDFDVVHSGADKRPAPSVMGFGRRKDQEAIPSDIPELVDDVKVDVYVRCRPMSSEEIKSGDKVVLRAVAEAAYIKLKAPGHGGTERYNYDGVFGTECCQEELYNRAARPIVNNVLRGMNCCMFAYGQTGTGKTHTMVGDLRDKSEYGIIPRSIADLFSQLHTLGSAFKVAISFLEVYNEQLMDLLIPPEEAKPLRLVEDPRRGAVCQNLTEVPIASVDEAMALLAAGNRRCQVATTLKNDRSNRAHRVFIVTTFFNKGVGDALRQADDIIKGKSGVAAAVTDKLDEVGCLTIVDLAGSECVGRSGATDVRLLEASNINKSLLTLGRVINALANNEPRIPYRDSKLTRLTAEALGGRCKTAIIATVAPGAMCSVESSSTLKYAERARSALNSTQLSKTQVLEAKLGRLSQLYKELQSEFQQERETMEREKETMKLVHEQEVRSQQQRHEQQLSEVLSERDSLLQAQIESMNSVQRSETVFLRATQKCTTKVDTMLAAELSALTSDADGLQRLLAEAASMTTDGVTKHVSSMTSMISQLSTRLKALAVIVKEQTDRSVSALELQNKAMQEFAEVEANEMKKTAEEMIKSLAKLLSRHVSSHATRVDKAVDKMTTLNRGVMQDVTKMAVSTQSACAEASNGAVRWCGESKATLTSLMESHSTNVNKSQLTANRFADVAGTSFEVIAKELHEVHTGAVRHNALVEAEMRKSISLMTEAVSHHYGLGVSARTAGAVKVVAPVAVLPFLAAVKPLPQPEPSIASASPDFDEDDEVDGLVSDSDISLPLFSIPETGRQARAIDNENPQGVSSYKSQLSTQGKPTVKIPVDDGITQFVDFDDDLADLPVTSNKSAASPRRASIAPVAPAKREVKFTSAESSGEGSEVSLHSADIDELLSFGGLDSNP